METDLNNLTMRDLFAMFAMAGLLSAKNCGHYTVSVDAYRYADAMMEQKTIGRDKDATQL